MKTNRFWRCLAAAVFMIFIGQADGRAQEIGIVLVDDLNLRPQADSESPPINQLKRGSELVILNREPGWLQVRHNQQVGYVRDRMDFIRILALEPNDDRRKLERYRQEVEELGHQLQSAEQAYRRTARKESAVLDRIDALDRNIHALRRKIAAGRRELQALDRQIEANRRSYQQIRQRIEASDEYVAGRLVALYKLNQFGTLPLLASAESLSDFLQRKKSLEYILQNDERIRTRLAEDLERRKQLGQQLEVQKARKHDLETSMQDDLGQLAARRSKREQVLARIRNEKSLQQEAIDSLRNAAEILDRTIAKLMDADRSKIESPSLSSFSSLKGLLKMPVQGKIVNFFGPQKNSRFNVTVFRSGIDIQAEPGAIIQAVYAGRVVYADWFKGYGNLIIIDHGDSYYTVYAGLEELRINAGDDVHTGAEIATVGDTALMTEPVLHFEVRHHGTPLDPLEWVVRG